MAKRLRLVLTDEQKRIVEQMQAEAERERPQYVAEGRRVKKAIEALRPELQNALSLLLALRKAQGVSLNELAQRTGLSRAELTKWESDPGLTIQLPTLQRIAEALGQELRISVSAGETKSTPRRRTTAGMR